MKEGMPIEKAEAAGAEKELVLAPEKKAALEMKMTQYQWALDATVGILKGRLQTKDAAPDEFQAYLKEAALVDGAKSMLESVDHSIDVRGMKKMLGDRVTPGLLKMNETLKDEAQNLESWKDDAITNALEELAAFAR